MKYHKMASIIKAAQGLSFEINGETFHGAIGDQDDPKNVRMCSECRQYFILGTSLCATLSCTGPITKAVRDGMMIKEAHRIWKKFLDGEHVEDWQLSAYLEIPRDHPMNAMRLRDDETSATNVTHNSSRTKKPSS